MSQHNKSSLQNQSLSSLLPFSITKKQNMGEGREGDWECSGCQNRNYAFRSFCNRCKQPRLLVDNKTPPDSKWLPRIGDWICTGQLPFIYVCFINISLFMLVACLEDLYLLKLVFIVIFLAMGCWDIYQAFFFMDMVF